jgi:hypothetical protein
MSPIFTSLLGSFTVFGMVLQKWMVVAALLLILHVLWHGLAKPGRNVD